MGTFLRDLAATWRNLLVLLLPLVLLPLPLIEGSSVSKCAYGMILMAVFWITEALPLAVTALIPVVVFPLFSVVKVGDVCANYIKDTSMFGFGGLTIAIAVEHWNLHKRIALRTLLIFGSEPKWLMFGFMLTTWFLSMWMSNTATTTMMVPIVGAVVREIKRIKKQPKTEQNGGFELDDLSEPREKYTPKLEVSFVDKTGLEKISDKDPYCTELDVELDTDEKQTSEEPSEEEETDPKWEYEYARICQGLSLCVAYAANIGGTGALSGTGPNIIMQGQSEIVYSEVGLINPINFTSWMVFALPVSVIAVVISWFWLQLYFLGWRDTLCVRRQRSGGGDQVKATIRQEYNRLGTMTFAEVAILCHFLILAALWFSREPPESDGWGSFFPSGYVGDSTAAILVVTSLFTFPSKLPRLFCFRRAGDAPDEAVLPPPLLDWYTVEKKFPWGVLLLVGGGYALADASQRSGLSQWVGDHLTGLGDLDPWLLVFILTVAVAFLTEITSNSATVTILLPILSSLARTLQFNPLYLMFPCTIATSFAFMLPVATPPNAIVFASGYVTGKDMAKAGFGMNIICLLTLLLGTNTWGAAFFDFTTLPDAFRDEMQTTLSPNTTTTPF